MRRRLDQLPTSHRVCNYRQTKDNSSHVSGKKSLITVCKYLTAVSQRVEISAYFIQRRFIHR